MSPQEETDYTPEKFYHLHDIDGSGGIDKQEMRLMLITELRDAYRWSMLEEPAFSRNANKTFNHEQMALELEKMKDEVRINTFELSFSSSGFQQCRY